MNKTQLIEMLEGPASAEFTFMPVSKAVELIKQLEETPSTGLSSEKLIGFLLEFKSKVIKQVSESLNSFDIMDMVDKDSAEFSLDHRNCVQLEEVSVDVYNLENETISDLETLFSDTISELQDKAEEVNDIVELEA